MGYIEIGCESALNHLKRKMPIIPFLTDSYKNMDGLLQNGQENQGHYVLSGTLYLRGKTQIHFFEFIQRESPKLYQKLSNLYQSGSVGKEYKDEFYQMFHERRNYYQLSSSYTKVMREKIAERSNTQMTLFD